MADQTINVTSGSLSWASTTNTELVQDNSTNVLLNPTTSDVWWWIGTGTQPAGNTNKVARDGTTFDQTPVDQWWSYRSDNTGGSAAQITLKVTGRGGTDERPA